MNPRNFLYVILAAVMVVAACKKDNYEEPKSILTGRVVYQGQALGLRSNGVQLELWQHGYQLFTKIPVYVDQDGSFSATLFNGDYKLVKVSGNGPWVSNTDSIDIKINGSVSIDVSVDPYFIINQASVSRSGTALNGTVNIQQVNSSRTLEYVAIFVGQTAITDLNNSVASVQISAENITNPNQPVNITIDIPASLSGKDHLFVRFGVKTTGVAELLYSVTEKVSLK